MLSVNKPLMQQAFANMLMEKTGMLYKAAYDAHYAVSEQVYNKQKKDINDMAVAGSAQGSDTTYDIPKPDTKSWDESATAFAKAFVKALKDGGFDSTLADQIDTHVKSAQIDITVPALLPTIISPMGPCTGSLSISTMTGAQIMIS